MRRIDVIGIGFGVFVAGGLVYLLLQGIGLDRASAGIWSQVLLVGGLVGWLVSYLVRVMSHTMTYSQQIQDYETAVLEKRWEEMTPEEQATLQAELAASPAAADTSEPASQTPPL